VVQLTAVMALGEMGHLLCSPWNLLSRVMILAGSCNTEMPWPHEIMPRASYCVRDSFLADGPTGKDSNK